MLSQLVERDEENARLSARVKVLEEALTTIKSRAEMTINGRKYGAGKSALSELDNIVKHCVRALSTRAGEGGA